MQDKSTYKIKQWSLEEIQKFHKENPFVIVEDEIAMIGFYPTKEIAQTIKDWPRCMSPAENTPL